MIEFSEVVSCVIDIKTGKRVSKWYSRYGDALNMASRMNYRFGGQIVSDNYKAVVFEVSRTF